MGTDRGFLDHERKDPPTRPVAERLRDMHAVDVPLSDEDICEQAARCMDCGIPFCHGYGCPLYNVIPEFNELVRTRRWEEALAVLLETNCFPEFTGRVCPAPCEPACVLAINDDAVTICKIELAIIEKGFERGYMEARRPQNRQKGRVAVVGSGPAGLAAADVINRAGFEVVVYENDPNPGGILRYGIPDFKLEKWVVDRRIKLMSEQGVVFETGVEIGVDISHRYLEERFDAIVLTGGAREPRDIEVPGRELKGIHFAMQYLTQHNRRFSKDPVEDDDITAAGKNVVILGGGDTGSDCLGTALRQGARRVLQFEILPKPPDEPSPRTPWPMWPDMVRSSSSHKEGGERRWSVSTKEFLGEAGNVRGLRCVEVEWVPGADGRMAPKEKPRSKFIADAELVLLAMGFVGPGRNRLVEKLGIEMDARGFIKRDENYMTSSPGTFVAGDMTRGASLVVRAIYDGMQCARGVIAYLRERESARSPEAV